MSTKPLINGPFACTRCGHSQYDHNDIQGCPYCQCAANRREAESTVHYSGGAKPYTGPVMSITRYLHDWQRPAPLVPADRLSEREEQCLRWAADGALTPPESRELQDFLGYPDPKPQGADRVVAVVERILGARARGEHIA